MFFKTLFDYAIRIRNALLTRSWNLLGRCLLHFKGVETEGSTPLCGIPKLTLKSIRTILLGKFVILCSDSRFTDLGVTRPVILRTLRSNALISIGSNTGLSGATICAAISVVIGSECLLGADVQIFDTDFHKVDAENRRHDNSPEHIKCAPVLIEDNVFIGTGSKVLKGVTIGRNSVIGAVSIVCKNIPPNSIAAGNPAKVIGYIN